MGRFCGHFASRHMFCFHTEFALYYTSDNGNYFMLHPATSRCSFRVAAAYDATAYARESMALYAMLSASLPECVAALQFPRIAATGFP